MCQTILVRALQAKARQALASQVVKVKELSDNCLLTSVIKGWRIAGHPLLDAWNVQRTFPDRNS